MSQLLRDMLCQKQGHKTRLLLFTREFPIYLYPAITVIEKLLTGCPYKQDIRQKNSHVLIKFNTVAC